MQNHIINLFPKDLFKTVHVNSKIAHRQIRSTGYEYTKKSKPMIIFRPRIADVNEDRFLKGTPLIERLGDLYSTWGATNLQPFMDDPKNDISVKYQLNRSVLYVDVVLVFSTLMQQIDYIHYFPAYHMSKKYWYSVMIDESLDLEALYQHIDESYRLVSKS